jgi:hypothetical protein
VPDNASFIQCNVMGHAWDQIPADRAPEFGVLVVLRCDRCKTIRDDILNRFTGELLSRAYRYPQERPHRLPMQDARVELMNLALIQARATRRKRKSG